MNDGHDELAAAINSARDYHQTAATGPDESGFRDEVLLALRNLAGRVLRGEPKAVSRG